MAAAGVAVSVSMGVLKPVLEKLATLLGNKYKKFKRVRDEVSFLVKELGEMKALLEDMDNAEGELNLQAKKWRKDIIDMSYVIEDCIDNFMDCVGDADDKVGILKKASHYLRTIKDRYRIANQISEIKTRVIKARNRRDRYKLNVCTSSSTEKVAVDPRLSALYKDSTTLVGIDTQKVDLVKWVNDEEKQLKVISIVGFGGLGKTTLANEVYCEVKGNFNSMAFVPISQKPDISRLLSSVCSKLGLSPSSHACEVQELIDTLREYLHNKRYLIVLDDLWEVIHWNIISCAFPKNNQQSRLIVTTRIEGVALACRIDHGRIHYMKPLSDMDSRLLFFTRIFGTENTCSPQFTGISSEILKRCGGLPLAIVTMASTLVDQPIEQWEYIKHSIVTESAANSLVDMMHILDLSYKNLPQHLRACFLYLGIYPEDYSIQRDQLIELLVAERIVISRSPGQDARDVAQSYLNELVNKNMIQPTDYGYSVHDMMLDLILKKCREANFVSVVHSANIVVEQKGRVHRLSVSLSDADDDTILQVATNCCQSQVRSLVSFGASKWMPPLPKLKSLRVLYLEFPEHLMRMELTGVGQLSQLRYLKVRAWSRSECSIVLPSGIWRLQHLERLEIYNIPVCITPSDIVDLPCLSHLILSEATILPDMIGKMKALRILSSFVLAENLAENIRSLGELNKLEVLKLKWLRQTGDNTPTTTWMDALIFSLEKLSNLKTFWLQSHSIAVGADALLLLSPPFQNIEVLLLDGLIFSGVLPRWIRGLQKLRVLSLGVKQMPQEDIDIIGTLPCLIHLRLWIPGVPTGRIVIGGTTGFNALEKLDFNCDVASYLIFEVGAMPSLRELSLFLDSHKWDKVTPRGLQYLSSLKYITVWMVFFDENTVWMVPSYSNEVTEDKNSDARSLISRVFQEAADAHPSHPAFNIWKVGPWARPSDVGLSSASRLTFLPRKGMEAAISSSLGAMGPVLRKLDLLLAPEFRLRKRVKDGIGILKEDLEEVSFVLVDLSMLESPSARAKCWMEEARELSYQVEDFVDEMMLMCTDAGAKIRAVIRHRVGRLKIALLPALPRRSTRVAKIAQLRTLVWQATERLERYQLGACCSSQNHMNKITQHHWHHRPPALYGDAANLVGIEATRMTLIEMLTGKAEQQLKVVSIAGPAGVGKTTLAKEIFREVRGQFELRAFVHSSRKIDMRRLLGTIISQVHQHHQQPSVTGSVQSLIDTIQEQLQDKRYLIVIDDLWEETAWDIVRGAFPEGNNCSRIVATTENMNVALKCCSYMAHNILKIKPLGIQDSGYLFFNQVFGSEQQCPDKLKEVSYGIIRKCCGLPLSLIHVAGLLASIDYSELWYHVHDRLCSIINRSHTVEEIQKKILNLSYNSLPHCLKTCLLYFNMYPEGYIMWKVHLVKQWTAEGFIDAAEGKDRQEIADGYFDELVNRGMIQPMKIDYNDEVLSCTVHHIIFDLIKYNSKEEEFIAAIDYSQPITGLSSKAHRLSYQFSSAKYAKQPARITMSQLRSLGFFGFIKCMPLIVEFKHLRVLVLDFWGSHDGHMSLNLSRICILFQLRYLKISGDIMVELPAQMQGLHYLETLDIDAGLSAVPVDIVHLPRLLHLGLQAVTKLPDGIGHIRSLSTLLYFDLRCNSEDNIRSLGQLTNLRHLHLTCSAVLSSDHLKRKLIPLAFSLGKLGNLKSLTLTPDALTKAILFDISSGISSPSIFLQRLELLPPICFFSRLPTWFGELHKLRILKVVVKELQGNDIKNISGLPSLIVFSLYVQTALTGTISFSTMAFPALKYFKFTCGVTSLAFQAGAMPSLRRLKICFNAHRDENHGRMLDGIEHLVNLQEVSGQIGALPGGDEYDRRAVKLSLEDTIRKHPRCLRFNLQLVDFIEEEYPPLDKLPQRQHDEHEIAEKDCSEDASSRTSTAISPGMKLKIKSWIRGALLGSGSFGMVYEAITDEGLFFAVKEVSLLDQGSKAQQSIFALEQEIALLSQFQHENIVQYYGTDKEESTFYIFVELVTQGSLSSLYQKYILRESEVSAYTRQILNGLVYLHELNVVHRDIRCANILVHANGSVKLADFGLGKITGINSLRSSKSSVYWMAPEVINPKMKYGHPADIWSLGCTVLEMLTGQIPFPDVEWTKALFIIGRGGQPHIPSNLSREAQDFIHQCVRVDPETRPSASQLLEHPFVNRTQIQKKVLAPSSHILPVAPPPKASMTANLDDVEL